MVGPTEIREFAESALDSRILSVGRARSGGSTEVYRIRTEAETAYLRLAEDEFDNLTSEAEAHRHLREVGVSVPEVLHVSQRVAAFKRSVMITKEIPGEAALGIQNPEALSTVLRAAGRDLCLLNSITVDGFGWVLRVDPGWPLKGEKAHYAQFVESYFPQPWPGALEKAVEPRWLAVIEDLIEEEGAKTPEKATFVHGDFGLEHIFHRQGEYTGLIDLGEMRGADPLFDLGHFLLQHPEGDRPGAFEALISGYEDRFEDQHVSRREVLKSAMLLGARQLARWLSPLPERGWSPQHPEVVTRAHRLAEIGGELDDPTPPRASRSNCEAS